MTLNPLPACEPLCRQPLTRRLRSASSLARWPRASSAARSVGSASSAYAALMVVKSSEVRFCVLSGWYLSASRRHAFFTSASDGPALGTEAVEG